MTFRAALEKTALEAGFAKMGICRPVDIAKAGERLKRFLEKNYHGQMKWLNARATWRADPNALWPEAKSVIMLADLYTPESDSLAMLDHPQNATISAYARNRDYHDTIKKRLKAIRRWMIATTGGQIKVFVDTAPVMEKPLAAAAGLGWQGKHTNLLARDLGNWFFLGTIFTDLEIEPSKPASDHCGNCRACLDICPTNAFPAPYQLDARRCISYLTIEHKGPVAPNLRPALGNRIYGCDDCLAVCPWNKFARKATETRYHARADLNAPALGELAKLDDLSFRQKFSGSPIKRIGVGRFLRNVLYAIGNSGEQALLPAAKAHLEAQDETLRDAASWAAARLSRNAPKNLD